MQKSDNFCCSLYSVSGLSFKGRDTMTHSDAGLSIQQLSFCHGNQDKAVLKDINLHIPFGSFVALIGDNGAGKTTLAKCIAGLHDIGKGTISLSEHPSLTQEVGLLFQQPHYQILAENVEADLALSLENRALPQDAMHKDVAHTLTSTGLQEYSHTNPSQLDDGDMLNLALHGTLISKPSVLISDEPGAFLAPEKQTELIASLKEYAQQGGIVLYITHKAEAIRAADRVILLEHGGIAFDGITQDFFAQHPDFFLHQKEQIPSKAVQSSQDELICQFNNIESEHLHNFSYDFKKGCISVVHGGSHQAQTGILEHIAGLKTSSENSRTLYTDNNTNNGIAFAIQHPEDALFEEFVIDDIAYALKQQNKEKTEILIAVKEAMELFGLPFHAFKNRKTHSLSGGEKRRVALAGLYVMHPQIFLLDSPLSALDTKGKKVILSLLAQLKEQGISIIIASPTTEECAIADETIDISPFVTIKNATKKKRAGSTSLPIIPLFTTVIASIASISANSLFELLGLLSLSMATIAFYAFHTNKSMSQIWKNFIRPFLKVCPWIFFVMLIQYAVTPNIQAILFFFLHFAGIYLIVMGYLFFTPPTKLMHAIEDIFFPLSFFGIRLRNVSFLLMLIMRFMDIFAEEYARINIAHHIRNGLTTKQKGLQKIRSLFSLFIPLMLKSLARADILEEVLSARHYNANRYSRYARYQFSLSDTLVCIVSLIVLAMIIFL